MSTTFTIVCDGCCAKYWAGQGLGERHYLYDTKKLAGFLFDHAGHPLRYLNDHSDEERSLDYSDIEKLE